MKKTTAKSYEERNIL